MMMMMMMNPKLTTTTKFRITWVRRCERIAQFPLVAGEQCNSGCDCCPTILECNVLPGEISWSIIQYHHHDIKIIMVIISSPLNPNGTRVYLANWFVLLLYGDHWPSLPSSSSSAPSVQSNLTGRWDLAFCTFNHSWLEDLMEYWLVDDDELMMIMIMVMTMTMIIMVCSASSWCKPGVQQTGNCALGASRRRREEGSRCLHSTFIVRVMIMIDGFDIFWWRFCCCRELCLFCCCFGFSEPHLRSTGSPSITERSPSFDMSRSKTLRWDGDIMISWYEI